MKKVCTLILFAVSVSLGQFSKVGTSAGQFLKFAPDPRTAALGGANAGTYGEISSLYWNPAGIAAIKNVAASFSNTNLYAGISYNFIGAVIAVGDNTAVGISAFYLDSGDMEQTTISSPDGTGAFFNVKNYALGISYAMYMTDWLMAGMTVKYVREDVWHESAQAVAVDIGSVLETGLYGSKLGISISNFGTDMQLAGDDLKFTYSSERVSLERGAQLSTLTWPLPLTFRVGISFDIIGGSNQIIESESHKLGAFADYNEPNDANARGNYGVEYEWEQMIAGRIGYYQNYDTAKLSYGLGLKFDVAEMHVGADFAYVDFGRLGFINQYSISLKF